MAESLLSAAPPRKDPHGLQGLDLLKHDFMTCSKATGIFDSGLVRATLRHKHKKVSDFAKLIGKAVAELLEAGLLVEVKADELPADKRKKGGGPKVVYLKKEAWGNVEVDESKTQERERLHLARDNFA
jgi:hypothetical protein